MNAVILAAGRSTRLRPLTDHVPKCLLPVAGRPILHRAITTLAAAGVTRIVVVTGYLADTLERAVEDWFPEQELERLGVEDLRFVENELWESTNNCYSFLLGAEAFAGDPFLSIDGDVIFDQSVVDALLGAPFDNRFALRRADDLGDEEMKVELDASGCLRSISKSVPPTSAAGEAVGLWTFSSGVPAVVSCLRDRIFDRGLGHEWYESSFQQAVDAGLVVHAVEVSGYVSEIDTPADLARVDRAVRARVERS